MRRWVFLAVLLPAAAYAQPVIQAVVQDALVSDTNFVAGRLCPGIYAVIQGSRLGPPQRVHAGEGTDALPFSLGGVSVTVNQQPAGLFFVESTQLLVHFPVELSAGPATVVVEYQGQRSAPFSVSLATHAPTLFTETNRSGGTVIFLREDGSFGGAQNPARPGEFISLGAAGLGPTNPVVPTGAVTPASPPVPTVTQPRVTIGGRSIPTLFSGLIPGFVSAFYFINVQVPPDLLPGNYPVFVEIAGFTSPVATLPVGVLGGMALTQTGFTFQAVQGGGRPSPSPFRILNGTGDRLNFTITTSTISGGSGWLSVSLGSGAIDVNQAPPLINVRVDHAGLSPGDYYGQVRVEAPEAPNSPQILSVVLNVSAPTVNPGPEVFPTGLVFVGQPGGAQPAAQAIRVTNLTASATPFTTAASFDGRPNWFTHTPSSGDVNPGQPVNIQVRPAAGLPAGVYRGALALNFPRDNTSRLVNLLAVIAPPPVLALTEDEPLRLPAGGPAQTGCVPARLLPVFTLLGANFNANVAWPTPIAVNVVDDCGAPMSTGAVTVTFSNGDPPLALLSAQDGRWSGTWAPRNVRTPELTVSATARQPDRNLEGAAQIGGNLADNPEVPILGVNGVVSNASFAATAQPSPGEMVSVFGERLSEELTVAPTLPLPSQLRNTSLTLAGRPLPLFFTSPGQIGTVIPYDIPQQVTHQIIARRGNRLSVPEPVTVMPAQPAVFPFGPNPRGQGIIQVFRTATEYFLNDRANPAVIGDVVVIYCTGLGAVDPPVAAGAAATSSRTVNEVTVTIGGRAARVDYAGLTAGLSGLYQINTRVPEGVVPGDEVPVVVTVAGFPSVPVTMVVR
jgi:uncharacterized protein (TIGR03437 family)